MSVNGITENNQYLTFVLDDEVFALDISQVREVLEFNSVTRVPQVPDFMRGVINLRGSVVSVLDMRLKFGMGKTEQTINTCIIIVEIVIDGEQIMLGALADSVKEVMDIDAENIEPPPKIGTKLRTDFIKGMGKVEDGFIIILDIDNVFSSDELLMVQDMKESVPAKQVETV